MQKFTEEKNNTLERKINKRVTKYLIVNSILIIVCISLLAMPRMINAYSNMNINDERLYLAETSLRLYNDNTSKLLPEEKELLEYEDIMPKTIYNSDVNYYLYSGWYSFYSTPAQKAWNHARALYYSGLIHGASIDYQCTFFAQMWFYDVYGFNSSGYGPSGNGSSFADRVYASNGYHDEQGYYHPYFEYGSQPKTMGIISISSMSHPGGHVICVDEVDYLNNTITISDGNVTNVGDVRIRKTYTLEEFYYYNPGRYTFVNPTNELLELINA